MSTPTGSNQPSGPMLLLVGNFLSETASRSATEELAVQLSAQGWHVRMTSSKTSRIPRLWDMLMTTWRSRSTCSVALVDVYSGAAFIWAAAVCLVWNLGGKPLVLTLHGGNLPRFSARWPRVVGWLLGSATAVTAPSRYLLHEMVRYRSDLQLHPNGLSLGQHTFLARTRVAPRLVWVRSFHEIYNPRLAVQVLGHISGEFPGATLTMIGPDKGDGSLQATRLAAVELGVLDRVQFVGRVPKAAVPGWLDKADVFLNTTNVDNTPLSVLEAMASGLCVVSTNVGGLPYLLDDGADALLVPPDDSRAMADAVRRLLHDQELGARLSIAGHAKAQQFDWSVVMPKWQRLLSAVARTPGSDWTLLPNER